MFLYFLRSLKTLAQIMFCRPTKKQNGRGGVASTYLELERNATLFSYQVRIRKQEVLLW